MLFIMVTVLIVAILLGVMAFVSHRQKTIKHNSVRLCIDKLGKLKTLLILIQQHRGLSTGFINGDTNLQTSIDIKRSELDRQWDLIERTFPEIKEDQLFSGIASHWQRLKTRWSKQTASNNIEQHNRLILNLLYLIENHAEQNIALAKFCRHSGLDVIWNELLDTIEALGQARAIGMSMVAAKQSSAVERVQLNFLLEKVTLRMNKLRECLVRPVSDDHSIKAIDKYWANDYLCKADKSVAVLFNLIEQHLFKNRIDDLASDHFFQLASAAIEPLDTLFTHATETIEKEYFT